jgi:hypothetical protein
MCTADVVNNHHPAIDVSNDLNGCGTEGGFYTPNVKHAVHNAISLTTKIVFPCFKLFSKAFLLQKIFCTSRDDILLHYVLTKL